MSKFNRLDYWKLFFFKTKMKINKSVTSIPKHCSFESALTASAFNGANGLTNSFID